MRIIDGELLFSASDLTRFQGCRHATTMDLRRLETGDEEPVGDEEAELLQKHGIRHEEAFLAELETKAAVASIETKRASFAQTVEQTRAAMAAGHPAIYQAALRSGAWGGFADFLERVDRPSALGAFSYEVVDTKLKRSADPKHVLQLVLYSDLVAEIQGTEPERAHLVLGDGQRHTIRLADVAAWARRTRERFLAFLDARPQTRPEPVAACALCGWREHCRARWKAEDGLALVAGIARSQRRKLEAAGVGTMSALAALTERVPGLAEPTREKLVAQARLQAARRRGGPPAFELRPPEPGKGFALLPRPDEGDVFYDIEGDPYVEGGLEYLHGLWFRENGDWRFEAIWAHDRSEEAEATRKVIAFLAERMRAFPRAHVYHYAPYEITALRRLAMTHRTGEAALDTLLRGQRFVDLYRVVAGGLFASEDGYSLKDLEAFYMDAREGDVATAGGSVVAYEKWLETGEPAILEEIRRYNEADCRSTQLLRDWLLREVRPADLLFPERGATEGAASDEGPADDAVEVLRARLSLLDRLGPGVGDLVADLNVFHAREKRPGWWGIFDRLARESEELVDDLECLAGLEAIGDNVPIGRGGRYARDYRYPDQDTKLSAGDRPCVKPADGPADVCLAELDPSARTVRLEGTKRLGPLPDALDLLPAKPLPTEAIEAAIARMTEALLAGRPEADALTGLLARRPPRFSDGRARPIPEGAAETELPDAVAGAVAALERSALAIQGPPGTGKTYVSARAIVGLVAGGRRVAVASNSHKAIENLLVEVCKQAAARGLRPSVVHKVSKLSDPRHDDIVQVTNNDDDAIAVADVVGATAWHFARYEEAAFSHLVVDEAGQVSLANLMAMAVCADNVVLVGDPMQLSQPLQGAHPGDSGRSCLDYALDGARVVRPELGVFLPVTRRLHPSVCGYVSFIAYEGALRPDAGAARQRLVLADDRTLEGAMLVPVEHAGRSQVAEEEIEAVRTMLATCLAGRFADRDGNERAMRLEDVLVVAPYNAQVNALRAALPQGARVGTVDRFQGQEAPVCLVSMTTSGAEDLPRGLEFLFSMNRINVAVSRAMVAARVFASPRLLDVPCRTVDQIPLVNAVCRLPMSPSSSGLVENNRHNAFQ